MEKKLSAWCKNAKIEMINRDLKTTTSMQRCRDLTESVRMYIS